MTSQDLSAAVKKNPISATCAVLIVALLLVLYIRGGAQAEAEADLVEKAAKGERYAANMRNAAELEEQLNVVTAANKEIASRAVRIDQLGTNSQYFYKLEGDTGVKLIDFRQTTQSVPKAKTTFIPVGFSVSVQGELAQILQFLRLIESGAHYSRVLSASISGNTATRSGPLTMTLSLELLGTP